MPRNRSEEKHAGVRQTVGGCVSLDTRWAGFDLVRLAQKGEELAAVVGTSGKEGKVLQLFHLHQCWAPDRSGV